MKYEYICKKTGKIYEVSHPMDMDAFKTIKELTDYIGGKDKIIFSVECNQEYNNNDFDENDEIERLCFGGQGFIFKGTGWPSNDSRHWKYTGKRKAQMDKLREGRGKRVNKGLSVADVGEEIGLKGVKDSVIPNKKWEALGKEQKETAISYGLRPSKDFTN
jgi:predicted nucleic acid-binding Zn ribbon protein